jgi:DNA-binding transcriptional MerR regulator
MAPNAAKGIAMGHNPSISQVFDVPQDVLTIGEMAREYGVTLRALRFYEDRGLLRPVRNGVTRYYSAEARARLELILKGKQLGFTLSEIRDLIANHSEEPVRSFELSLDQTQILTQISMLQRQRDDIERAIEELRQTQERLAGPNGEPPAAAIVAAGANAGAGALKGLKNP